MISMHDPIQILLMAAEEYVPQGLHIRVVYCAEDQPGGFVVAREDADTIMVALSIDQTVAAAVVALTTGLAVAISGDERRGAEFASIRDTIRAAYDALRA